MKKMKRTSSTGCNKTSKKDLPNHIKLNSSATTIRNKPKKALPQREDKQNILILEPAQIKNGKVHYNYKKKLTQKKNKRSKSLIYDKKPISKVDMTHNSSRTIDNMSFLKKEDPKEQASFPLVSIHHKQISALTEYSPAQIRQRCDYSAQTKNILIEDAYIQCDQFELEQRPQQIQKRQKIIAQNEGLKKHIKKLENDLDSISLEAEQRFRQLEKQHEGQATVLNSQILQLKEENLHLTREKQRLKNVVKDKDMEINKNKETQKMLENCLRQESTSRQGLAKDNERSKREIEFYKKELASFEDSLADLRKMKGVYETRLDELEHQKIRIKRNACQLLQMVEKYKSMEQSD